MSSSRQLAAIMFTDIVGYTSVMGEDEQNAFDILRQNRELQKPLIKQFNGRWIKEMGDGVLASFSTVTDAVQCALQIQKNCSEQYKFKLRIGIHLGEVIFEDGDIFGDGVNIASRIQSLASVGGIWVSEAVENNIRNKKEIETRFVKQELLKHVKEPVKIFEIIQKQRNVIPVASNLSVTIPVNGDASIAVLPFVNMSNDPAQEYFCDGISEEIINALAQLANLRVVARTSAFTFKNKNADIREIGKVLNVNTVLEGSVRKAGDRLRITTKLIRVSDGSNIWSNRYDRVLEDVFAIQEDIAENVATALQGVLTNEEKEAIRRTETGIEAYEYFLKGRQLFHQLNLSEAKKMFQKALVLDPQYAPAYAGLADTYSWLYEWEGANDMDIKAAKNNCEKALALAPNSSESHSARGFVLSLAKNYDEAEQEFKEAIRLNVNSYDAYYYYGRLCFARGQIDRSVEMFRKASEVRREDFQSILLLVQSLHVAGRIEDAKEALQEGIRRTRKQLELNPMDRRALSLGAGNLLDTGNRDEALQWINKALELYPEDTGTLINAACFFAKDGNKEKALELLETVFGKGFGKKDWIENDPDYDSLRKEPRFIALLEKLK